MAPEKRKTLLFEPSVVSQSTIDFYVSKGYFPEGVCRPPGPEVFPVPRSGEVVVFKDFFTAGLRIPMDPVVPKLLEPFNVKLHHFTPNGIAALSKFLWVARTFGGEVSVDAFCRLFQLHCQPRKVFVDDDDEESEVQNGCCTFVPRKSNKKTGLTKVVLAAAQRNKWEGNWLGYWFYAKIGFPDPEGSSAEKYLLASDIEAFDHTYQLAFNKRAPGFKPCVEAFMTACQVCGGRDVVEEFLAAGIWPLSAG